MRSVSTRAGEVYYDDQGDGVPIVMLHATLHTHHDYDTIVPKLAKHYRCISVDWPWHGESKGLPAPELPSAMLFADVLEDFVAALALPPAIIIGNSVGGYSAARLAIRQSDHVRGLVLINNGGFVNWDAFTRLFAQLLGYPFVQRLLLPTLVHQYMKAETDHDKAIEQQVITQGKSTEGSMVAAAMWRSFVNSGHDLRSSASEIKCPTLIVWGGKDPVAPLKAGREILKYIPAAQFEVLQTGHVVFSSKPNEFLALVEPFIEGILAAEGKSASK